MALASCRSVRFGDISISAMPVQTVSPSFQLLVLWGRGDAGGRGCAGTRNCDRLLAQSIHWTVGVSGEPSKGVGGGGDLPSLVIMGEVVWWRLVG